MRCTVCGAELKAARTGSVVQGRGDARCECVNCPEYLIEDGVLGRVDEILARVDTGAELEIIRYAA